MPSRLLLASFATALALLAALPARAQNAITLYGGYRGGGSFEQTVGAATTTDGLDGSGAFALGFEWAIDAARNGQIFASGQHTHLQLAPGSAQASVPIDIAYLHLGATFMSPGAGLSSEVRPSLSLAVGYEHPLTPSLSLRGELRGYATLINSGGGFFCSGGCVVSIHGDAMFQADALLGLSLRF